uniref:NADH dehydrogenase subunit 2 n=1 Tax=Pseudoerythrocladia kornmannii TaxID=753682 RepID=UPI001FCE261A|nr:NADH dehydrogenase subunit 2 [Pseudoerythrocladia kornmannii]UNJ19029.1 NADH dehydrogenase subunit 2 [Pseudoerythrocladia kornmannii]
MFTTFDFFILSSEVFLLSAILIILVFGVLISSSVWFGCPVLNLILGKLTLYIIVITFFLTWNGPNINISLLNDLFLYDSLFLGIKYIVLVSFLIWVLASLDYVQNENLNIFEYWILSLFSLFAMFCLLAASDILTLYMAIELQSLSFYILASLNRTSEFSTEAGLKYFIIGAFSSIILLFGFSLLYGSTGLTHFEDLNKFFLKEFLVDSPTLSIFLMSLTFILVSLLFKISAAPFHMWSPDIYEGAPTGVTLFFAIMPKVVVTCIIIRLFSYNLQDVFPFWQSLLLFSAILSLTIGTFGAFVQTKWKRFLAFSSINHQGFILLSLATGSLIGNEVALYYTIIYIIMTLTLFTLFLSLRFKLNYGSSQIRYLKDICMLGKTNPSIALCFMLVLFSMGGVPPLAGFLAKVLVILEVVKVNLLALIVLTVLLSSIACFYYLRLLKTLYFQDVTKWPVFKPVNKNLALLSSGSSILLLYFCVDPSILQFPIKVCFTLLKI